MMGNWEIVLEGRQGSNDMLNVLHYQSSGVEPPDFDAAATVIRGHLVDHIQALCGSRVTWEGITVREDIEGGVGTFYGFSAGTLTGSAGTADQADILSMLVRKHSGGLVRPTKGWLQQGGLSAVNLDPGGTWSTALRDEVEAFWEDLRVLNITGPTTLTMVIKARNPSAPNTQAYSPVNSITTANTPRGVSSRFPSSGS